ncbi:BAG domain protein [Dictyocaulus viviparus]|uniref:BAG domain protein n=1 Tax=Dictyocaulus viviparus TaxID=29172 RepID=A0A0D8XY68_DICVI|nr:BAG domain protein [Dictyocaulus viviparus]
MAARIIPITIQRSADSSNNDKPAAPIPAPPIPTPMQVPVTVPAASPSPSPPSEAGTNTITSTNSNDEATVTNPRLIPMSLIRNRSIDDFNEQVVHILDEVEKRVEQLREAASMLEQEKEQILDMLNSVSLNSELLRLGQGDREDINAITNRLAARTKTVDVVVNTPRSAEQEKALTSVNSLIDGVVQKLHEDLQGGKETCRRYLNACNPDQPDGPIDQKFQAQLIECTADDQKKIRRKLAQLISQFERAERTFSPHW